MKISCVVNQIENSVKGVMPTAGVNPDVVTAMFSDTDRTNVCTLEQ